MLGPLGTHPRGCNRRPLLSGASRCCGLSCNSGAVSAGVHGKKHSAAASGSVRLLRPATTVVSGMPLVYARLGGAKPAAQRQQQQHDARIGPRRASLWHGALRQRQAWRPAARHRMRTDWRGGLGVGACNEGWAGGGEWEEVRRRFWRRLRCALRGQSS